MSVMGDRTARDRVLLGLAWPTADNVAKIADAMSGLAAMSSPDQRQKVFEFVNERDRAFQPDRNRVDLTEITNFILACGADEECFDLMLDAIEMDTPADDPELLELKNLVNMLLPRAALTKNELRELLALGPDRIATTTDLLGTGIRRARPERIAREGRDIEPGNVRKVALLLLDSLQAEKGLGQLLRFVDWLAELAPVVSDSSDASMAGRLRDWVERVAGAHGLTGAAWRTAVGGRPAGEPALLIELEPALEGRFTVYLWLWVPGSGPRTLDWDTSAGKDEDSWRLDELRDRLDDLLELASRGLVSIAGRLRVEFLLDVDSFIRDVDWWPFGADEGLARPLGAQYTVTVRRQHSKAQEERGLQERWQAMKSAVKPVSELVVWARGPATPSLAELWTMLNNDLTRVLVAPLGTCAQPDPDMKKLLYLALKQGMPVALGMRRAPADAARDLDNLAAELSGIRLTDLPELVRTWREQAFSVGGDHFGQHLVLIWDDYDRRLPSGRDKLAVPAVKGAGR
jgi:hypothetical protein